MRQEPRLPATTPCYYYYRKYCGTNQHWVLQHTTRQSRSTTPVRAYPKSPRALVRLIKGDLNVLDVQRLVERVRNRALFSGRDKALPARPPRLPVLDVVVPSKLARTPVAHAAVASLGLSWARVETIGPHGDTGVDARLHEVLHARCAGVLAGPPVREAAFVSGGASAGAAVAPVII